MMLWVVSEKLHMYQQLDVSGCRVRSKRARRRRRASFGRE